MSRNRTTSHSDDFDPYHKWLGIPKDKRPPTFYQLLGISPSETDRETIEASGKRQTAFVKQFRGTENDAAAAQLLVEIDQALFTLLDKEGRRRYDLALKTKHRRQQRGGNTPPIAEGRIVGEESGIVREYSGIVAILCIAFFAMGVAAFWLPWGRLNQSEPGEGTVTTANADAAEVKGTVENPPSKSDIVPDVALPKSNIAPEIAPPKEQEELALQPVSNNGLIAANQQPSEAKAQEGPIIFTSLRLVIDEEGNGKLTVDSRSSQVSHEAENDIVGKPIELESFGDALVSRLDDGRLRRVYDFRKITDPDHIIPPLLKESVHIDGEAGVLVLTPSIMMKKKVVEMPLPRMVRLPLDVRVDLLGMSEGMLHLTVRPGPHLLAVAIDGEQTPEKGVKPGGVRVFTRPEPSKPTKSLLSVIHGKSELKEYSFTIEKDAFEQNAMLAIAYFGDLPLAISRIEITAKVPPSFGIALEKRGNRIIAKQVVEGSAASKAGVKVGDALLAVNGKPTSDVPNALNLLAECGLGAEAVLRILRFGTEREIKVLPQ